MYLMTVNITDEHLNKLFSIMAREIDRDNLSESDKEKLSLDDYFELAIEDLAAEKEVTVDYYMAEFM